MHPKKIASYDIWDTVIRRRCHPDAVKIHTARDLLFRTGNAIRPHLRDPWLLFHLRQSIERQIGIESQSKGLDDEYALPLVLERWVKQVTVEGFVITPTLIKELIRTEIAQEKYVIYIDPTIHAKFLSDGAKKRIFISDFYLGKEYIFELLKHINADKFFDDGYVSCDIGLNKRSGRLFQHVLNIENQPAQSFFHFGDNQHSDVNVAHRLGLNAELFLPHDEHTARIYKEKRFTQRKHTIRAITSPKHQEHDNEIRTFAHETAALFIGFILQIQEQALAQKLEQLFFFTREGEFFLKLYQTLRATSPYCHLLPEGVLLEVSRLSTFGPSLRRLDETELMRLWNLYSTQSPRAFLKSLDLCDNAFAIFFEQYDLPLDVPVQYPWSDHRINKLFKDPSFLEKANAYLDTRKNLFLAYCRQIGLTMETKHCGIVDIGWRGTIQDNIAYIFPDTKFTGFYLGLSKTLNEQPQNTSKQAFGPNLNIENTKEARALLEFVAPIEMLSNSTSGSVTGYEQKDIHIVAKKLIDDNENRVHEKFTSIYQKYILEIVHQNREALRIEAIGSEEMVPLAINIWSDIIQKPNLSLANAYFSLMHNETFGVGKFISKSDRLDYFWPIKLLLIPSYRPKFKKILNELAWTAGYAKMRNDRLLLPITKKIYKR
ncbi:MAG: hypothetical protein IT497_09755 [Ottowia sp.]|nr:hypothetical protein [Ottowia sp.]